MATKKVETNVITNATKKDETNGNQQNGIQQYVKMYMTQIGKALPEKFSPEKFQAMVLNAVRQNPELANCTPQSFVGAFMNLANLGLEANTPLGEAYLIPRNSKNGKQCELQIGYKGLLKLAYNSGELSHVEARTVYQNDTFEYSYGLNPILKHIPSTTERGEPIAVYAICRLKNSSVNFEVMSISQVKEIANNFSQGSDSKYSPWQNNFEAMAQKTVLKRALRYLPVSVEVQTLHEGTTNANVENGELIVVQEHSENTEQTQTAIAENSPETTE